MFLPMITKRKKNITSPIRLSKENSFKTSYLRHKYIQGQSKQSITENQKKLSPEPKKSPVKLPLIKTIPTQPFEDPKIQKKFDEINLFYQQKKF